MAELPGRTAADPAEPTDVFAPLRQRRVRVLGPQRAPSLTEVLLDPSRGHLREDADDAALHALIRTQLRLAVGIVGGFFAVVVLTVVLIGTGAANRWTVASVPLEWLIPGAVLPALLLGLGWFFVRRTEAREARWARETGPDSALASNPNSASAPVGGGRA